MASTAKTRATEQESDDGSAPTGRSDSLFSTEGSLTRADFRLAAVVSIAFTAIATFLLFSRSNYYIELADQSLYLLMTDDPRAAIRFASGYHVLLSPLFSLVDDSVINFRRLRAVIDIGVDVGLGISLLRYLRSKDRSGLFEGTAAGLTVVFSVTLSGFAAWIYAVNGFGYDQLGAIVFTGLVAAVLWIIGGDGSPSRDALLAALGGAFFAMALIVRWTAALASVVFFIWVLVEHVGVRKAITLLGGAFVGAIGAFVVIHIAILDITVVADGIVSGTQDIGRDSHTPSALIGGYFEWLYSGLLAGIGLLIASVFALILLQSRKRFDSALLAGLLTTGLLMFIVQTVFGIRRFQEGNLVGTYLALICSILILARFRENQKAGGTRHLGSGLALPVTFTVLPVLLAAGSFLPIFLTSLPLATLWVAGLWLLLPKAKSEKLRSVGMVFGAVLLSGMPVLVWQALQNPARTPFAESPVLVDRGRYEGLFVDEETQQLLHDLEDLRVELDPNPTVLSFWVRPAVAFALDGTGLGFPWYSEPLGPNAAAQTISGACLEDGDTPTGQVVIVTEETNPAEFGPIRGALRDCGIDFPVGFELVETMVAPRDTELFVYVRDGE